MFINIPNSFSSMWGELTYEYNSSQAEDIVIEIFDSSTCDSLGVKKFYSSTTAKINVAPILFDSMLPDAPVIHSSSSVVAATGFPRLTLSDGSESCQERVFSYSTDQFESACVASTMPSGRLLYREESDILTVLVSLATAPRYEIWGVPLSSSAQVLISSGSYSQSESVLHHYIVANEYCEQYSVIYYKFYDSEDLLFTASYSLVDELSKNYRVAWLSSRGSIEHYTFSAIVDQRYTSEGEMHRTLRSAYGRAAEIEAISEMLSSPKVWKVDSNGYTSLEVLSTEQPILSDGSLMIATIKVSENVRG